MKLEEILHKYGITYKAVSENVVNINCPLCIGKTSGQSDSKFRCGIFRDTLGYHCFRCHGTGSLFYLLNQIEGISKKEYNDLVDTGQVNNESVAGLIKNKFQTKKKENIPQMLQDLPGTPITKREAEDNQLLSSFMKKRNISLDTLIIYKCRICGCVGDYAHRLILPIYYNGEAVSFQARDITNKARQKFLNPVVNINNYIYPTPFEDKESVYIVEGIFDAWRMQYNTVAVFGKALTKTQRRLLRKLKIKNYIFCLDSDAYYTTIKEIQNLKDYVENVGVVSLPKGKDPDDLGRDVIEQLPIRWK